MLCFWNICSKFQRKNRKQKRFLIKQDIQQPLIYCQFRNARNQNYKHRPNIWYNLPIVDLCLVFVLLRICLSIPLNPGNVLSFSQHTNFLMLHYIFPNCIIQNSFFFEFREKLLFARNRNIYKPDCIYKYAQLLYIVTIHFTERIAYGIFATGHAKCPHRKKYIHNESSFCTESKQLFEELSESVRNITCHEFCVRQAGIYL